MDAKTFTEKLTDPISSRLAQDYQLRVDVDKLPSSVEFTVISDAFTDVDYADRIQFLADVVEDAFGLPLQFTPMGLAITPAEDASGEWDETEDGDDEFASYDDSGTAARSLD